ncbi:hypothetical protein [Aliivibrio fischeri]|uniref:hypothetical protein n=1 Tax=Aliivibrio fischeri TaxID=668 RepID=UPI0007C5A63C|nr:hypothetical protein [Aliivibrio fischeri]
MDMIDNDFLENSSINNSEYQKQLMNAAASVDDIAKKENLSISAAIAKHNSLFPHASIIRPRYYDVKKYLHLKGMGCELSFWGSLKLHTKIKEYADKFGIDFDDVARLELEKKSNNTLSKVTSTLNALPDISAISEYLHSSEKLRSKIFVDFLPPKFASQRYILNLWCAMHLVSWAPDRLQAQDLIAIAALNKNVSESQNDFYLSLLSEQERIQTPTPLAIFLRATIHVLKKHSEVEISEFEVMQSLLNVITSHHSIEMIIKKINEGNINEI